tara:strand:- start:390 stop:722 length:333 start_codon:yes stop_codon:yes gene_type:complete
MPTRYSDTRKINNFGEYYKSIRRGKRNIIHYETPILKNLSKAERASIQTTAHVWKYGDRFYKLADLYYNDARFWWVIAWYNIAPTEATLRNGSVIYIPLNLTKVLSLLGV